MIIKPLVCHYWYLLLIQKLFGVIIVLLQTTPLFFSWRIPFAPIQINILSLRLHAFLVINVLFMSHCNHEALFLPSNGLSSTTWFQASPSCAIWGPIFLQSGLTNLVGKSALYLGWAVHRGVLCTILPWVFLYWYELALAVLFQFWTFCWNISWFVWVESDTRYLSHGRVVRAAILGLRVADRKVRLFVWPGWFLPTWFSMVLLIEHLYMSHLLSGFLTPFPVVERVTLIITVVLEAISSLPVSVLLKGFINILLVLMTLLRYFPLLQFLKLSQSFIRLGHYIVTFMKSS